MLFIDIAFSISLLIADAQYYWAEFFKLSRWLGIKTVIPAQPQIKKPFINLRVKHIFIVEGELELVRLCHGRVMVKHVLKHGKERLNLDSLRWRGAAKVRMHVALCYSVILAAAITAHKMGRPSTRHKSIPINQKRIFHRLCARRCSHIR